MGFGIPDGVCNTGLGLGLNRCHEKKESDDHHHENEKKMKVSLKYDDMFPSLTLGLALPIEEGDPISAVCSFSNSSVKKEREFEVEVETKSDEDDQEGSPRKKLRLTKQQSVILEDNFKQHTTLNPKQKQALAQQLCLRPRQVEVWFQNRRARTKLKQTEVDCEVLKKCCETLTEENKRLQKEVEELKSMKVKVKVGAPLYMHTLSICPSCERIGGADASSATVGPPKPHLFSAFTAACL
ncbi:homeobox-leucine zipper protein HAT22-like [Euphorbia lathyris]|uniref:homeobox-leucine zipper protein HAT22-like n=1 Tax=Euphorbia lathyris TaxID=212925 RepID=UPI0033140AA7